MKNLIFIFLFIVQFSYSQELEVPETQGLSQEELTKAIEGFKLLAKTDGFKVRRETSIPFFEMLPRGSGESILIDDEEFAIWISERLHLSKFSSVEEAVNMRKNVHRLNREMWDNNAELFELIGRATNEQRMIIYEPAFEPESWGPNSH